MENSIGKSCISERKIVKKLYGLLYGAKSSNRYRLDGIPVEEFLKDIKKPALKRALSPDVKVGQAELENFKKIEFYLESCIEQGFIKIENGHLKLTAKGYNLISFGHWREPFLAWLPLVIAFFSLVATTLISYYTYKQADALNKQAQDSISQTSAQFVLNLSSRLDSGKYMAISNAIENHPHSYSPLKAGFTDNQLENYMSEFDTAGNLLRDNIITFRMAYDEFSYDTEKVYCNKDVQNDITRDRKGSSVLTGTDAFWSGFENMAEQFLARDKYTCSSTILDNQ